MTNGWRSKSKIIRSTMAISKARSLRVNMAAGPYSCGIAATGRQERLRCAADALKDGNLKFRLDGARLHGSWVLVRMKHFEPGASGTTGY